MVSSQNKMHTVSVAHNEASVVSRRLSTFLLLYYNSGKVMWNHQQSKYQSYVTVFKNQKQELFDLFSCHDRVVPTSSDFMSTAANSMWAGTKVKSQKQLTSWAG